MKRMLTELSDIKEIMVVYAGNKKKKTRYQVIQSRTSELQQSLLSILNIQKEENPILGWWSSLRYPSFYAALREGTMLTVKLGLESL